ncbi:ABC transporter permease [Cellulomonas fengjieae]|nr:ABC transporter permease [Cellulomonas fengjieae]QVI66565.1 ABC transporter permease [Cellulomonas fengjieae]
MTTMTTTTTTRLPGNVSMGLARGRVEILQFFRQRDAVVFTFAFPAFLMAMLGLIFTEPHPGTPVSLRLVLAASIIAYGIVSTAFMSTGIGVAVDRDDGTLKRLRGTPVTATAYLLGKLMLVVVVTLGEVALLLTVAVLAFGLELPTDPGRWATFAWLLVLSTTSCTLLGIGFSALARSARSATAVMNVPAVALGFVSGIFVHILALPDAMVTVASFFPLKWMGQGFRAVFLPDTMAAFERARSWELGRVAIVLGVWTVMGLALCLATFRWRERRRG